MDPQTYPQQPAPPAQKPKSVKIFGVGTAGINTIQLIAPRTLPGVECVAVGACAESLAGSLIAQKICLAASPSSPENIEQLKPACSGAGIVFIVAGLGGATGTRVAPLVARAAREAGALSLAIVTLPFQCEGNRRRRLALDGLAALQAESDGVLYLQNQKILNNIAESTSLIATFKLLDEALAGSVGGIWNLVACRGMIEISPAELCEMLRDHNGESSIATASAAGPERSREALEKLFAHPMMEGGIALKECDGALVSVVGGPDLTMAEVNRIMETVDSQCKDAQILVGAGIDESCPGRLSITLIATRRKQSLVAEAGLDEAAHAAGTRQPAGSLEKQLLKPGDAPRTQSRFVPPPPSLPPEKLEQLMANQRAGSGRRKGLGRMRQGQLPLEIVSRGRFDKSEPTIHKGEDLDVPTYIRRGMALN